MGEIRWKREEEKKEGRKGREVRGSLNNGLRK